MADFINTGFDDPFAGSGAAYRKSDAYYGAGNSLKEGDYTGARNSLLQYGLPDDAQKIQAIQNSDEARKRANAAEGRTVAAKAAADKVGALAASGDIEGAKALALKSGNLDLATSYGTYQDANTTREADKAKRDAIAQAAKLAQAGDLQGAQAAMLPHISDPQQFVAEVRKSKADMKNAAANLALAYEGDPEGWAKEGVQGLKQYGIDPHGFDSEAGRKALIAGSSEGLAKTIYSSDAKAEQKSQGGAAKGDLGRAQAMLASFHSDHPDTPVPSAAFQQLVADKNHMLAESTDASGNKTAIAVLVDGRTKTAVDVAEQTVKANEAANARDGGNRPTDILTVYHDVGGGNTRQQNADTRAALATPERRGAIAGSVETQKLLARDEVDRAGRAANLTQLRSHIADAVEDADNPTSEHIFGRIAQGHNVRAIRESLTPESVGPALARRNVLSDVEVLREETQRFFKIQGQGALTDTDKARIDNLLIDLERSPNKEVFKGQLQHLDRTLSRIVAGATARGVINQPAINSARQQSADELGASVGAASKPQAQAPAAQAAPPRPAYVPAGSGYSPTTGQWYTRDGQLIAPPQ